MHCLTCTVSACDSRADLDVNLTLGTQIHLIVISAATIFLFAHFRPRAPCPVAPSTREPTSPLAGSVRHRRTEHF